METIHIFDEFSGELTTEERHQKRTRLEPLIFDILKQKYWKPLDTFWQTHSIPSEAEANKCSPDDVVCNFTKNIIGK